MILNVLAAHVLPISLACNALFAPAIVWALISLRSSRGRDTCSERALAERTVQLHDEEKRHSKTQEELKTARGFIAAMYPLHRQEAETPPTLANVIAIGKRKLCCYGRR